MELNSLNVDLFQNFLGVIFESENDANGIQKILQELHGYVPYVGDGEMTRICKSGNRWRSADGRKSSECSYDPKQWFHSRRTVRWNSL